MILSVSVEVVDSQFGKLNAELDVVFVRVFLGTPFDSNADIAPENQHSHGYVIDATAHETNNGPVPELSLNLFALVDVTTYPVEVALAVEGVTRKLILLRFLEAPSALVVS